jgi:hypothetical protein
MRRPPRMAARPWRAAQASATRIKPLAFGQCWEMGPGAVVPYFDTPSFWSFFLGAPCAPSSAAYTLVGLSCFFSDFPWTRPVFRPATMSDSMSQLALLPFTSNFEPRKTFTSEPTAHLTQRRNPFYWIERAAPKRLIKLYRIRAAAGI